MWWVWSELAAAEARKAEGASCTELLIPRPPDLTGHLALNSDLNWEQRSCMDRQKRSGTSGSPCCTPSAD